ncbi:MAG TPA: tRNA (adenosine(37)-N6)-threonylcarbamoyltransferase complex ATPase subunit type 1 TsaE [Candidatus Limnocylindrales bacterium]|nr:tRNA (adenosine(37)-N6)-threonylcarbamoyltransferase complex ATPase subunit type 1 TsaE [Candidatus Limnocylindrales bacterium]
MTTTFTTKSYAETQKIGTEFSKKVKNGGILALYGNLGSGKTTFTQGVAKGLGIKQKIISPTFIIVRKYDTNLKSSVPSLNYFYHIDLYRIEKATDIKGLGLEEILNDKSNIVAVEWPEKIESLLPKNTIKLKFKYLENDEREIEIT